MTPSLTRSPEPAADGVRRRASGVAHAAANPHRLRLLVSLAQCPKGVERLAVEAGLSVASASAHLKVLQSAELVTARRVGRHVISEIADDSVFEFLVVLRRVVERRSAEGREAVAGLADVPWGPAAGPAGAGVDDLQRAVTDQSADLIDVRQADEYAHGHLPGAASVPAASLPDRVADLVRRRRPVAAYCRGPYCRVAAEAVRQMRSAGVRAAVLPVGVIEWRAAGLPLERDAGSTPIV